MVCTRENYPLSFWELALSQWAPDRPRAPSYTRLRDSRMHLTASSRRSAQCSMILGDGGTITGQQSLRNPVLVSTPPGCARTQHSLRRQARRAPFMHRLALGSISTLSNMSTRLTGCAKLGGARRMHYHAAQLAARPVAFAGAKPGSRAHQCFWLTTVCRCKRDHLCVPRNRRSVQRDGLDGLMAPTLSPPAPPPQAPAPRRAA